MLIDDEEQFRNSVKIALKRKGLHVETEADGLDGLENIIFSKTSGEMYDLIILDIMMPKVTGIDILEYMMETHIDVPVIIVTGFMDYDLKFFCSGLKKIIVLEKPFSQNMLIEEVLKILNISAAGEAS